MSKTKTKKSKPSVIRTVLFVLLGLATAGALINAVNYSKDKAPEEETPIVENEVLSFTIQRQTGPDTYEDAFVVEYEDGMTWADWAESEYFPEEFTFSINESTGYFLYDANCPVYGANGSPVKPTDVISPDCHI